MSSRGSKKRKDSQNSVDSQQIPYNVLNDKKKEDIMKEMLTVEEFHSGPLPHPSIMRQYNDLILDGAERIFSQFEKQTNHRIQMEKIGTIGGVAIYLLSFSIIILIIVLAYRLALNDKETTAGIMMTSAAGIVFAFYKITRYSQEKEE